MYTVANCARAYVFIVDKVESGILKAVWFADKFAAAAATVAAVAATLMLFLSPIE